jgi:hypothetical protein
MDDKRFTEAEMAEILRDASTRPDAQDPRYTLEQIQSIAEEASISPALVAQAAASLSTVPPPVRSTVLGAPTAVQSVRRVSRAASAVEIAELVSLVRIRLGETGITSDVGGAVEWRYNSGYSSATVSILPHAEGTVVRVEQRADGRQFILYFGAAVAVAITGFVASTTASPTFSVAAAAVAAVPYLLAARTWWNRSAARMVETTTALADELANRLTRP